MAVPWIIAPPDDRPVGWYTCLSHVAVHGSAMYTRHAIDTEYMRSPTYQRMTSVQVISRK